MGIFCEIRHCIPGRVRFYVPGVRIAGVAAGLKALLEREPSVASVRINPACDAVVVSYQTSRAEVPTQLKAALESVTVAEVLAHGARSETQATQEKPDAQTGGWMDWFQLSGWSSLALTTVAVALSLIEAPLTIPLTIGLSIYNALPVAVRAFNAIVDEHRLNVDVLDGLAIGISTLQGRLFTTTFMIWLITLGDWIRDQTAAQSKNEITSLLDYQQRRAWVLRGGDKVEVQVTEIAIGDTVVVYSGDMIPVDGEVSSGYANVDQRSITGESMPVERQAGDKVYATSVMHEGKLYVRASHTATNSLAAQIVRMVEAAPVGETRIQNYAEKFADRLVLPTLGLSAGVYLLTLDVQRSLSILIVDFGTGIRVAAPTAVLASMAAAVRRGVLIRGGRHMETLSRVDTVVFDKTGTLTEGAPRIVDIISYRKHSFPPHKVLALAAAAESRLKHPVAVATLIKARQMGIEVPARSDSKYRVGMGVEARVNGYYLHLGSERFLRENAISLGGASLNCFRASRNGQSSLLLAIDGELVGQLVYCDEVRAESAAVIKALRDRKIREVSLLSGDSYAATQAVALKLGLDRFHAEILPSEKATVVRELQSQERVVAMVGDGINDAPALSYADVGVAMRNGVDIAQQTADVVLIQEDLQRLVTAIDVSREAVGLVHQNYAIIAVLNAFALAGTLVGGIIAPELTALISNGSAVLASVNGLRPLLQSRTRHGAVI